MSQQINLYSPIFRKQAKVFSATTLLQGVALIVVVIAAFYFYISMQTSILELRAAESGRSLKSELERLKAYGAADSPAERAKAQAERRKQLETALASHTRALGALDSGSVGRAEGYSELLRALARLTVEGVWLTRIRFSEEGEISISGRATRPELVAAYLERLRSQPALREQPFSRLELTRPKGPYVEFTLSSAEAEGAK